MPSQVSATGDDSLTLDMVGQFTYCPRRFHLMYVEGRWEDNEHTIEGRHAHRRVDRLDHVLPDADAGGAAAEDRTGGGDDDDDAKPDPTAGDEPPTISRSVPLTSSALGLTAKLDLVATDERPNEAGLPEAVPVETKKSRVPNTPQRSHDTHRVQLMAQGLLLREHGYHCDHGVLYFAGSRTRVDVPFTDELEATTRRLIEETRVASGAQVIPPPLEDSPKCHGCSLAGICMPDETLTLRALAGDAAPPAKPRSGQGQDEHPVLIRRLYPARPNATPLYVQEQGAYVGKSGKTLIVRKKGEQLTQVRLKDTSQLVLCGNVQVSTQTLHLLCEADIPVIYLSTGMWFYGLTHGITLRNAYDRAAQFAAANKPDRCLAFARQLVKDKAANQRTMLRRNARPSRELDLTLRDMDDLIARIDSVEATESLLGVEGAIAALYFQRFADTLKGSDFEDGWDFQQRNRRPPRDPVNAMLSFAYALLAKECTVALLGEGLDPWWGLYHRPRHGRPALALDLMEPFRPVVADSAVITAINTGMVKQRNFERSAAGCVLQPAGRKALLRAYEARLDQLVTHPVFEYRCSWRSIIRLQARLLARWLRGDVQRYENVVTR